MDSHSGNNVREISSRHRSIISDVDFVSANKGHSFEHVTFQRNQITTGLRAVSNRFGVRNLCIYERWLIDVSHTKAFISE